MAQKLIQSGEGPRLVIEKVEGNLVIRGWERPEVLINYGDEESLTLNQSEGAISLRCEEDCAIQTPHGTTLIVQRAEGDSQIYGVHGDITIERVEGNLQLRELSSVTLEQAEGDFLAKQIHGNLRVQQVDGNANIADVQGSFQAEQIEGDAQIATVQGEVKLEQVSGNLRLRDVGPTTLGQVEGDVSAKQVRGELRAQNISGNATVTRIQGDFMAESVEGDLAVNSNEGNVMANVQGNAALQLNLAPGHEVRIKAEGDIACQVAADANAKVTLTSEGEIIVSKLNAPTRRAEGELTFALGTGEASLVLMAEGNITLSGARIGGQPGGEFDADFNFGADFSREFGTRAADFAQQIAGQIEQQVGVLTRQLDEKLANLGSGDEIATRVQEKVQAAMRRAEQQLGEAMRNAERRAAEAERRATEMDTRQRKREQGWGFTPPYPPAPPRPPVPPTPPKAPKAKSNNVNDEERLMILRMVSEGKLSVEQAEQLLAALNG